MKTSRYIAALAAVVLVASQASGQNKTGNIEQLKKELAALRAEVTALKEEVARLTKREEEERATKLKALREEVARLTREEEEAKAKKRLAESVEAWKALRTEYTQRSPLSFLTIPSVEESVLQKGEDRAIPVFSFSKEKRLLAPRTTIPNAPPETYEVSTYTDGVLTRAPDPGAPFGLDLAGIGQSATDDVRLKGLGRLKSLIWLNASFTPIVDEALEEVAGLKNLKWLDLRAPRVTDAGLIQLAALKGLQSLRLGFTKVTDGGLKELAALKDLQTLDLSHTAVTDAGLKELTGLKNLQSLDLRGTQVTDAGVAELQKALPACKIVR